MTRPAPAISLEVDLTNPGQFLACCGLLELASRLDGEAVGWFEGTRFHMAFNHGGPMDALLACQVLPLSAVGTEPGEAEPKSPPVVLGPPLELVLDWWEDPSATRAGFKTWAGGQTVIGFIDGMRKHLSVDFDLHDRPFRTMALSKPKPFYFDSRISRLTSLDLGFSPEKFTTAFSPAVELFAMIGLQRFRPCPVVDRERYAFTTWSEPLPVSVAAAVAHGLVPTLSDRLYHFPLVVRTGGKYKAFGPAVIERRSNV